MCTGCVKSASVSVSRYLNVRKANSPKNSSPAQSVQKSLKKTTVTPIRLKGSSDNTFYIPRIST